MRSFAIFIACSTDTERGEELLKPMIDLGPEMCMMGMLPYTEAKRIYNDPENPLPAIGQGAMLNGFTPDTAQRFLQAVGPIPHSPNLMIQLRHIDGAAKRGVNGCLGSRREAKYLLYCLGVPMGPHTPASMGEQAARIFAALEPEVVCPGPLNWLGERDVPATAIQGYFEEGEYAQLMSVKRDLDPQNLFRFASVGI
jgi:hypothetical protein